MNERATPNYYEIMQLQPYANPALVTASYRILSKLYHPDTARESANLDQFRLIQQAYEVLSDPQKRKEYDQELSLKTPGGFAYAGTTGTATDPWADSKWDAQNDNTWAPYTPSEEDMAFYRNLADYENTTGRRRAITLILVYIIMMTIGLGCGVLGFITAFSPDGNRGQAVLLFILCVALVIAAQLEAYFS